MPLMLILMSVTLGAIAALHAYWATGGLWPCKTERELIDTVIGNPRFTRMPPAWLTALVAVLLAAVAALPMLIVPLAIRMPTRGPVLTVTLLVAVVFLARGVAGYIPAVRRMNSAEPFATYDRRYYSPFCLVLGAGFLLLDLAVMMAMTAR